jgi:ethanolamine utilization microcompartment shell protein EutL
VPVVYPRRRYAGACNVQTIKDGEPTGIFPQSGTTITAH